MKAQSMNTSRSRRATAGRLDDIIATREELRGLRDAVRDLGAEHHDMITPEQVAGRLSTTITRLTRMMNKGILPRGAVWFESPLARYFSWQRLTEWMIAADSS